MKPILAASLLALTLAACGGPSEEDVLTAEKIRASESAPELPDVELSENPEPPPAPPEPAAGGPIPAAFQDRWGQTPADCRPGGGVIITGDTVMSRESVGRLVEVVGDFPERFIGIFEYDDAEREEELVLTGSSNTLVRIAGGQRYAYRRCNAVGPTG